MTTGGCFSFCLGVNVHGHCLASDSWPPTTLEVSYVAALVARSPS